MVEENVLAWSNAVEKTSAIDRPAGPVFTVFEPLKADASERFEELTAYSTTQLELNPSTTTNRFPVGMLRFGYFFPLEHPVPLVIRLSDEMYFGTVLYDSRQTDFYITDRGLEGLMIGHDEERREWGRGFFNSAEQDTARGISMLQSDSLSRSDAEELARGLRFQKHSNPVAGVIAAYLYNRFGDIDNIRRIALYYIKAQQPVPFDVALLARVDSVRDADGQISISVPSVAYNFV